MEENGGRARRRNFFALSRIPAMRREGKSHTPASMLSRDATKRKETKKIKREDIFFFYIFFSFFYFLIFIILYLIGIQNDHLALILIKLGI